MSKKKKPVLKENEKGMKSTTFRAKDIGSLIGKEIGKDLTETNEVRRILGVKEYFKYGNKIEHPKLDVVCKGVLGFEAITIKLKNGKIVLNWHKFKGGAPTQQQQHQEHSQASRYAYSDLEWKHKGPWIKVFEDLIHEQIEIEQSQNEDLGQSLLDYWES